MASFLTVARPYAKALFAKASEQNSIAPVLSCLHVCALTVKSDALANQLNNPEICYQTWLDLFTSALSKLVKSDFDACKTLIESFLQLVFSEQRLVILPDVFDLFDHYMQEQNKTADVVVTSALALTDAQQTKLTDALSKKINKTINAIYKEDNSIMGGMIIEADDWIMDGSVKSKLQTLEQNLNE